MRQLLLAPVALALAVLAAPSHAAIALKLSGYQVGTTVANTSDLWRTLQTRVTATSTSVAINNGNPVGDERAGLLAGTINVDGTGDKSFAAFCVELNQGFTSFPFLAPVTYTAVASTSYFSAAVAENVGRLYSQGITFDTVQKTAAFQIALWEVIYEKSAFGVGTSTAGNADFFLNSNSLASNATAATFDLAQSYLNLLPNTVNRASLIVYTNGTSQDLIVAIPEPTTYAMMLAGLAGIGFVGMRRARQQG